MIAYEQKAEGSEILVNEKVKTLEVTLNEKLDELSTYQQQNEQLEDKISEIQDEYSQHRQRAQTMMIEKDEQIQKLKGGEAKKREEEESKGEVQEVKTGDIQLGNLKTVLVKYLEQLALGKKKEIKKLETVLFTVLKASDDDIKVIKKARKKQTAGIWGYFGTGQGGVAAPLDV